MSSDNDNNLLGLAGILNKELKEKLEFSLSRYHRAKNTFEAAINYATFYELEASPDELPESELEFLIDTLDTIESALVIAAKDILIEYS